MKAGAFAFIDALGFKGIWKRDNSGGDDILAKLKKMSAETVEHAGFTNEVPGPVGEPDLFGPIRVTFLSDSIAMAVEFGAPPSDKAGGTAKGNALLWLVIHIAKLLRSAALSDPPLAYRGCITFGEFILDDRFILGAAVDQAAELERLAEGAFVWLDPKAKEAVELHLTESGEDPEQHCLHRTRVPLKNGQSFETLAVVPYLPGDASKDVITKRILDSFDTPSMAVVIKKENTRSFLLSAKAASDKAYLHMPSHMRVFAR